MRAQSQNYDPFRPVRRVGIRAEIALVDADAKSNATASASAAAIPSDPALTIDGATRNPQTFATLERNAWVLDGNHAMVTDQSPVLGWWSMQASGADGMMDGDCCITYQFSADAKTVGVVLHFVPGYQPAVGGMRIRTYDADGTLVSDVYNGTMTPDQQVDFAATYRSMRIDFIKTALPCRRIRVTEIDFGVTQRYDADSIVKAELRYKTDLSSEALPYGECLITVDNADHRWNLLNPDGIYSYLEQGQRITVWLTIDGEDVYMGAWRFRAVSAKDGALTAQITAVDIISVLEDEEYNGGRCAAASLSDAVAEVLADNDITCVFDDDIGAETVMMSIPPETTKRESLRLLAQAARACVFATRDGILRFCRPVIDGDAVFYLDEDGTLYFADGIAFALDEDDVLTAPDGTAAGILVVEDIYRTGDAENGTITRDELYNFDGIRIDEPVGRVRLIVNDPYADIAAEYTSGDGGNMETVKNPCVASENGDAVAAWLLEKYGRRKRYSVKNRCDPAVELGDVLRIEDAYRQNGAAIVTAIKISYNGGLYAVTEAIG